MFKNIKRLLFPVLIGLAVIAGFLIKGNAYALDYHDYLNKGQLLYEQGKYGKGSGRI